MIRYYDCHGFIEEPKIDNKLKYRVDFEPYRNDAIMMMVCPHCGAELVATWKSYSYTLRRKKMDRSYKDDDEAYEEASKQLRKSDFPDMQKRIHNEMALFLQPENFKCICCGESLSCDAGYYLNNCYSFNCRDWSYDDEEEIYPSPYGEDLLFKYHNEKIIRRHTTKGNIYKGWDNGIYCYNEWSANYCKQRKFENTFSHMDYKVEYGIPIIAHYQKSEDKVLNTVYYLSLEQCFDLMRYYRERLSQEERDKRVQIIIKSEQAKAESQTLTLSESNGFSQPSDLSKYLFNLIQIETDYMSLPKRLSELYFLQSETEGLQNQIISCKAELDAVREAELKLKDAYSNLMLQKEDELLWEKYYPTFISKKRKIEFPTKPEMPEEPSFETPGFFNKKRVEAENAQKSATYQAKMLKWEIEVREWKEETDKLTQQIHIQEKEAEQEAKEAANKVICDAETLFNTAKSELEEAKKSLAEKQSNVSNVIKESIFDAEVHEAEEALKRCVEAKTKYENLNIIYPKYRNFVAYSSFYEYLESGRCTALSGADGAYNLFENEQRQNIIITNLSKIVTSLEEIKANQYMVYSQLMRMNNSLDSLNYSMNTAVSSLKQIGESVHSIQDYTKQIAENSDIIAYNTEATAYYSKRNAELTDALGFLIALK